MDRRQALARLAGAPLALGLGASAWLCLPRPARAGIGHRIDIELQDTPIKDVIILFQDIGKVNIIAKAGVSGRVTCRFRDTPWDDVLAEIIWALHLKMRREGNLIYIEPW